VQVVVLTSGVASEDRRRLEALGVVASLMKPVKQSELLDAVSVALGMVEAREGPVRTGAEVASLPPLRILLAEDSVVNQKLAIGLLHKYGHEVTVANNGIEAVEQWSSGAYDVVLMDIEMPQMNGIQATAELRARERTTGRHVPIVAMTAHALQGDEQRCLDAGMDAYVSKPIRTQHLFETLAAVIATQEKNAAVE
jgi:CheY-like chemotaxis protein